MLSMTSYGREYIDDCRALIDARVAAYRGLAAAAPADAMAEFEAAYFNNLVMVLELCFVHRTRGLEKKDGNPLNEVRVLTTSIMSNDGRLTVEKQIKLNPDTSVLGLREGDRIAVTEDGFVGLAKAFFADIELKFL
jgi:hypothetical protein